MKKKEKALLFLGGVAVGFIISKIIEKRSEEAKSGAGGVILSPIPSWVVSAVSCMNNGTCIIHQGTSEESIVPIYVGDTITWFSRCKNGYRKVTINNTAPAITPIGGGYQPPSGIRTVSVRCANSRR